MVQDEMRTPPTYEDVLPTPELFASANGFQTVLMRPLNVTLLGYRKQYPWIRTVNVVT